MLCSRVLPLHSQSTPTTAKESIGTISVKTQRTWLMNSDFTAPTMRYAPYITRPPNSSSSGHLSMFNSVGAGLSFNFGEMTQMFRPSPDSTRREIAATTLENYFGFGLGLLFSVAGEQNRTYSLAPNFGIQILDFQLGVGYELGSSDASESRFFYSLGYKLRFKNINSYLRMNKIIRNER
jgi:hypothetical protein